MHKRLFWILACLSIASTIGLIPDTNASARARARALVFNAYDVIDAVNALRASNGLVSYSVNSILMSTAQAQANYMASIGTWTHTGPDGSSVTQRLLAAGYPLAGDLSLGGFRSENVVEGSGMTPAEAVASWTTDSIHLHTMLSADLQEIGAGVAEQDGVYYYVIDCARPTGSGVPQAYTPGAGTPFSGGQDEFIAPVVTSTPDAEGDIVHEVQSGQTLWQIAIAYGVKIDDIRRLNNLGSSVVIYPGDKLLIKHTGTATPIPPTATATRNASTSTPLPTFVIFTQTSTETATSVATSPISGPSGAGGAVLAIALVALMAAGLVAWAGRSRPV